MGIKLLAPVNADVCPIVCIFTIPVYLEVMNENEETNSPTSPSTPTIRNVGGGISLYLSTSLVIATVRVS
jgi:hypothetical protein